MDSSSSDELPIVGAAAPGVDDDASGARPSDSDPDGESVSGSQPKAAASDLDDAGELPRMLGERYRLERLIAKGGMGRVYEATQLPLERRVAIKLLVAPPNVGGDFRRRFLLEASICSRLSHPNIVVVHDYGETSAGELYMAMELLSGEPLNVVAQRASPLPPGRTIGIALQVARALRAAHREGIAHRDLKPGNVFLERRHTDEGHDIDVVKVLDFGLVKVFEDGRAAVERDLTQGDMMLGSPRYMSPEQIMCEPVDARTDIYSLGILLFALVSGRPPFVGRSPVDILTQHLNAPPPTIASVLEETETTVAWTIPAALEGAIHRCMAKDPADRFQTIDELIFDLKGIGRDLGEGGPMESMDALMSTSGGVLASQETAAFVLPAPGPTVTGTMDPEEPASRSRWPVVAALFAGAIALAIVAALMLPIDDSDPAPDPAPAPAMPETVSVTVTSEPSGAQVMSGGVLWGVTPLTRPLAPTADGSQRVFDVSLDGFESQRITREIAGEAVEVHVPLTPNAPAEPVVVEPPPVEEPRVERPSSSRRRGSQDSDRPREPVARVPDPTPPVTAPTRAPQNPRTQLPDDPSRSIVVDQQPRTRVPMVD